MNLFGQPEFKETKRVDHAYRQFETAFNGVMAPAKYAPSTGDFVQLNRLRRTMDLKSTDTPPGWESACLHYMQTPMGVYSLKDLATRYAVFLRSPLDRYGKPVIQHNSPRGKRSEYLDLPDKPPDWVAVSPDELRKLIKDRKGKT